MPVRPALLWILIPAIFIADLREPPGYEIPLLYTPVVLLTMWSARIELAVETAAVATLLTAIDFAIGRSGDLSSGTFNRILAIVVLWLTAGGVTTPGASDRCCRRGDRRCDHSRRDLRNSPRRATCAGSNELQLRVPAR